MIDHLPVELFHMVFEYLSADEIFYTFADLTARVDQILAS